MSAMSFSASSLCGLQADQIDANVVRGVGMLWTLKKNFGIADPSHGMAEARCDTERNLSFGVDWRPCANA